MIHPAARRISLPSRRCALLWAFLALMSCTQTTFAYCVYNETDREIEIRVEESDGSTLRSATIASGGESCAHYEDHLGLEPDVDLLVVAYTHDWLVAVDMDAGGFAKVRQKARDTDLGIPIKDLYILSFTYESQPQDNSLPSGIDSENQAQGTRTRHVRFLATADPQFWDHPDDPLSAPMNESAQEVLASMVEIIDEGRSDARGIVIAGDLTQNSRSNELKMYTDATGGVRRYFFDGIGNHHPDEIDDLDLSTIQRNTILTHRSGTSDNPGPHYSWDWDDVHFVQLNIFPGNGIAGQREDLDPLNSLAFLEADLRDFVGTTGRPVVLIHHYGFDAFSIVDWWTQAQRDAYLDAIANYNVIAMITGHTHLDAGNHVYTRAAGADQDWAFDVQTCDTSGMNCSCGTNTSCKNLVAGAARGAQDGTGLGVFLDIEINNCNEMIVSRMDKAGNLLLDPNPTSTAEQRLTIDFTTPGLVHPDCREPPVPEPGGPYTVAEGERVTFDASASSDPEGGTLEYRWWVDGHLQIDWSTLSGLSYVAGQPGTVDVELEVRDTLFKIVRSSATTLTVTDTLPTLDLLPVISTVVEGRSVELKGVFSAGANDEIAIKINWGDGKESFFPMREYTVGESTFRHQYTDDNPTGTAQDNHDIAVELTDDDGNPASKNTTVTVENESPHIDTLSDDRVNEGTLATISGIFTDNGREDILTATFDWGDGTQETFPLGDAREFSYQHIYATAGGTVPKRYPVSVLVRDDDTGEHLMETFVDVINTVPVITSVSTPDVNEGEFARLRVGVSDESAREPLSVTIKWGDGTQETRAFAVGVTTFDFEHRYNDEGTTESASMYYPIEITVSDDDGTSDTEYDGFTVFNVAPRITHFVASAEPIDEGGPTTVSGIFLDDGLSDTFTVTVDWGDGQVEEVGYVSEPVGFTFDLSHRYVDDGDSSAPEFSYPIEVTVRDGAGGSDRRTATATVRNVAPTLSSVQHQPALENDELVISGVISDPGLGDTFTVLVDWGDGAGPIPITMVNQGAFALTHRYPDDHPSGTAQDLVRTTIAVVDDDGGSTATQRVDVQVSNVAPRLQNVVATANLVENGVAEISGEIVDPGPLDTFVVDVVWGDDTVDSIAYPAGSVRFALSHQYLDNHPGGSSSDAWQVHVTLSDDDLGQDRHSTQVQVHNAPPALADLTLPAIAENELATLSGRIVDAGTLDTFVLDVDWGDGTVESFAYPAGTNGFVRTHRYPDDGASGASSATYAVTVTITDDDSGTMSENMELTVHNAAPRIQLMSVQERVTENGVVTLSTSFSDAGRADTFELIVDWGDGTEEPFVNVSRDAVHQFEHRYLDDNPTGTSVDSFDVTVTVRDDDTGVDARTAVVLVENVPPSVRVDAVIDEGSGLAVAFTRDDGTVVPGDLAVVTLGTPITVYGSYVDVGTRDLHSPPQPPGALAPILDWNDGTTDSVAVVTSGVDERGAHGTLAPATHTYHDLAPGLHTFTLTVHDDDTGVGRTSVTIEVADPSAALEAIAASLQELADSGAYDNKTVDRLVKALERLVGKPGKPEKSALGDLEQGDPQGAIKALGKVLKDLHKALDKAPELDLGSLDIDLAQAARSILETTLVNVAPTAVRKKDLDRIADARQRLAEGDQALTSGAIADALDAYEDGIKDLKKLID